MANSATGVTMEYAYDYNGLHTQKVRKVNGAVTEITEYTLHGKLIAHLTKGNSIVHLYFDA